MTHPHTTKLESLKTRLHTLYADGSKHAVYQSVPEFVREALGYNEQINHRWRSDAPRYAFLARHLNLDGVRIADVGSNTGYFSLNLARAHPASTITAVEPNTRHRTFIEEIAVAFDLSNLSTSATGWNMQYLEQAQVTYDVVLHLNILHHAGFDFDSELADRNDAFEAYAQRYLALLRPVCRLLCFQIGSNRGGQKNRPLFPFTDDVARLLWTTRILGSAGWRIVTAGHATGVCDRIGYREVPSAVLEAATRDDRSLITEFYRSAALDEFPGEFHRRPLLVCERS
jgi:hypothetical protein